MKFYRYQFVTYAPYGADEDYRPSPFDTPNVGIWEMVYRLEKETAKGYWIVNDDSHIVVDRHWVSKESRKRFAYPSKGEAMESFKKRTTRRIAILSRSIKECKAALHAVERMNIVPNSFTELEDLRSTMEMATADLSAAAGRQLVEEVRNGVVRLGGLEFGAVKQTPFMGGWAIVVDGVNVSPHSPAFREKVQRACVPVGAWLKHRLRCIAQYPEGATRRREADSIKMELRKLPGGTALGILREAGAEREDWMDE